MNNTSCKTDALSRPHADRARQFLPFDALKGLREALAEKERSLTLADRPELAPEAAEELNRRLACLCPGDMVTAVFFDAGQYRKLTGLVARICPQQGWLQIVETQIYFEDLASLELCRPTETDSASDKIQLRETY